MGDRPQAKHFPAKLSPMLPSGTFTGKVALVTGGGTGLGRAMSLMLSSLGASVAIMGRRQHIIDRAAKEMSTDTGNKVFGISGDIRDPTQVIHAVNNIEKEFGGPPTIVVNNAAGNFISPTERLSFNAFKTIVDIVLLGSSNVTLEIGKRLISNKQGGTFLAITTSYCVRGSAFVVPSASSKAGVENMMRSLASEWGRYGIRLNCLSPGPIDTGPESGAWSRLDPTGKFKKLAMDKLPVGRCGFPEEVANLACYLLSDYSSFITGETVLLDGGEICFGAGEFNPLVTVPKEQWDEMEKIIRAANKKQKGNSSKK